MISPEVLWKKHLEDVERYHGHKCNPTPSMKIAFFEGVSAVLDALDVSLNEAINLYRKEALQHSKDLDALYSKNKNEHKDDITMNAKI